MYPDAPHESRYTEMNELFIQVCVPAGLTLAGTGSRERLGTFLTCIRDLALRVREAKINEQQICRSHT